MSDITTAFSALQQDYIAKLNQLVTEANTAFGLRLTQAQVDARVGALAVLLSGLTGNLSAGGYKITNAGNAMAPGDLVNLATAQALLLGGGVPGDIPVTSLGVGTATALQLIRVKAGGAGIEGYTLVLPASANAMNYSLYGAL